MEGIGLYDYGARWFDTSLGRFLSPDSIVPDPYNPFDLDRYAYVRNNPLRYKDPTGHMCSDPEDPTPTCEAGGGSNKLVRVNYGKDKDNLTEGGRKAYQYYYRARNNPGWWNNNEIATLTTEQFLGIFMLYEAGGYRDDPLSWIKNATGYQLFLPTPDNFGGNSPYCTGEICRNGIFNFMASYQGYGKYGDSSLFVKRFATLSRQPLPPLDGSAEIVSEKAAEIGNDIVGNRPSYQTGDPFSVPFHWGNGMTEEGNPLYVTTVTGTTLFRWPLP
jgi:RHS repeat-associated protein